MRSRTTQYSTVRVKSNLIGVSWLPMNKKMWEHSSLKGNRLRSPLCKVSGLSTFIRCPQEVSRFHRNRVGVLGSNPHNGRWS